MSKPFSAGKTLLILLAASVSFSACKNGIFAKKKDQSSVTGWNYDDKNYGNFHVLKAKEQKAGPGLVFVQGGTFTMEQKKKT